MHSHSDELLVEHARKGSQAAFAELVRRHQTAVFSLCYRMTGNAAEAEDLAQESFLRLYRSLSKFRPGAKWRPWLHKITTNVCLDALRKRREPTLPLDDVIESSHEPPSPHREELPEEAYLHGEARQQVQRALLRLPSDYRVALILRYLEDLSYQEVADALGISLSAVETRLFRAKKALGHILGSPRGEGKEDNRALRVERRAGISLL